MTKRFTALLATLIVWMLAVPMTATADTPASTGEIVIPHTWICVDTVHPSLPCERVPGPTARVWEGPMPVVGESCLLTASVTNNESIHLTDLILTSDGQTVRFVDVERSSDAVTPGSGTITPGETGTVDAVFGPDGQTSLDVTIEFDCVPPTTTTTTTEVPPSSTTTTIPGTTTTTTPTASTTTTTTLPPTTTTEPATTTTTTQGPTTTTTVTTTPPTSTTTSTSPPPGTSQPPPPTSVPPTTVTEPPYVHVNVEVQCDRVDVSGSTQGPQREPIVNTWDFTDPWPDNVPQPSIQIEVWDWDTGAPIGVIEPTAYPSPPGEHENWFGPATGSTAIDGRTIAAWVLYDGVPDEGSLSVVECAAPVVPVEVDPAPKPAPTCTDAGGVKHPDADGDGIDDETGVFCQLPNTGAGDLVLIAFGGFGLIGIGASWLLYVARRRA